jgi:2-amino-4-hydroxy-6-hydroxymethyldihydropteridine diphosphokinase
VAIRNIEGRCGNRKAFRTRSIISIDVDILLYGDKKLHEADWERPYVKELMESLPQGLTPTFP